MRNTIKKIFKFHLPGCPLLHHFGTNVHSKGKGPTNGLAIFEAGFEP